MVHILTFSKVDSDCNASATSLRGSAWCWSRRTHKWKLDTHSSGSMELVTKLLGLIGAGHTLCMLLVRLCLLSMPLEPWPDPAGIRGACPWEHISPCTLDSNTSARCHSIFLQPDAQASDVALDRRGCRNLQASRCVLDTIKGGLQIEAEQCCIKAKCCST